MGITKAAFIYLTKFKTMYNFYSQGGEDQTIRNFINSNTGNILDIGANDGKLLSNSLHFIENGWGATLVEASPIAFEKLNNLHKQNNKVQCIQACLDNKNHKVTFYHNLNHYNQGDTDLLSTIDEASFLDSSKKFPFDTLTLETSTYSQIKTNFIYKTYDIISIDIEGKDYEILTQIDLNNVECEILIIEYNGNNFKKQEILNYCSKFQMSNIILDNTTNIVVVRD